MKLVPPAFSWLPSCNFFFNRHFPHLNLRVFIFHSPNPGIEAGERFCRSVLEGVRAGDARRGAVAAAVPGGELLRGDASASRSERGQLHITW